MTTSATTTEFHVQVFHGGDLYGLGIYARDICTTFEEAKKRGVRLANECQRTVGGCPIVEINGIEIE